MINKMNIDTHWLIEQFFHNSPFGLRLIDTKGNILKCNPAYYTLLGLENSEYEGHNCREFICYTNCVYGKCPISAFTYDKKTQVELITLELDEGEKKFYVIILSRILITIYNSNIFSKHCTTLQIILTINHWFQISKKNYRLPSKNTELCTKAWPK